MTANVDVQYAVDDELLPGEERINGWVSAALRGRRESAVLTIRIVDAEEGLRLNRQWRNGDGPTNVLSFPAEGLEHIEPDLLGDVIICAPVVQREANEQNKNPDSHWAHMVIHGTLHLLGYDHNNDEEAENMETLEIGILEKLGIANPYT